MQRLLISCPWGRIVRVQSTAKKNVPRDVPHFQAWVRDFTKGEIQGCEEQFEFFPNISRKPMETNFAISAGGCFLGGRKRRHISKRPCRFKEPGGKISQGTLMEIFLLGVHLGASRWHEVGFKAGPHQPPISNGGKKDREGETPCRRET